MSESSGRFRAVRELFLELSELDTGERGARISALAETDAELAHEVESLFGAERAAGSFLDGPAGDFAPEVVRGWLASEGAEAASAVGRVIGAWRIVAPLGKGGMGEVFVAERVDGRYEQRSALKLLKRGMDSREIVRRFLRERQILARLTHPGIARLLDGGESDDGRPFLVLELVEGETITEHARRSGASVEARLRLLVEACEAVESAHQKLVVHRDLKPSNVLVESSSGRVKLLDFGIAKLLSAGEGTELQLTRTGSSVMTPAYAAPEQILGEPATTATDVYALGVLLYELLAGRLPHRRTATSAAGLAEELQKDSVTRPSRVAAESGDGKLARMLAGDLDTIVLKALARESERRYPTVAALADDLRRHLEARPVLARADSTLYRARKFVGRHRGAVAASALAVVALVLGLAAALFQAARADREATGARREAARAERVRQFVTSIFEVSDPVRARGETVSAKNLLDQGAQRVEQELATDPDLRAEMQHLLAGLYRKLGDLDAARQLAESALALRSELSGAESSSAANSEWLLGWVLANQGQFAPARERLEHAIAVLDRVEGPESLAAADAREPLMEVLFGAEGPAATLAVVERRLATYRHVLGERDVRTAIALSDLGVVLNELERSPEAESAYRQSMAVLDTALPGDDPRAAYPHSNLADLLTETGRAAEAETEVRKAIAIRTRALGPAHPESLASGGLLTQVLLQLDRLDEAEANARELLVRDQGRDRFATTQLRAGLGQVLLRAERFAEALPLFEQAIAERRGMIPDAHVLVFAVRINRARALVGLGRKGEARAELQGMLPGLEAKGAEGASYLAHAREILALIDAG